MTRSRHAAGLKNLSQSLIEARSAENFRKEEQGTAGVAIFRDGEERAGQLRVGFELIGAGKEPGVDRGVFGAEDGLQLAGEARGVVDKEAGKNPEESREQFARSIGHVRACTVFDLREVGLAEATAEFLFHGVDDLGLRHRAA